jgi:TonB family protein
MPENILVVEYEPRYTDRVRQALAGQPFVPSFARDGEEAMRALETAAPKLIVLSSVVPKISTAELIRAIRGRNALANTPILLTVSGYTGKSPKTDAQRLGASDILPKPYSESEFLGKIQQMLGIRSDAGAKNWALDLDPELTVRASTLPGTSSGQLTSSEIFGDLLEDDRPAATGARKTMATKKDDLDKMLADTLAGVMPQAKKKEPAPAPQPAAPKPQPAPPQPAPQPQTERMKTQAAELDKLLNDTLSGLERTVRAPRPSTAAAPQSPSQTQTQAIPRPATPPPAPAPAAPAQPQPKYATDKMQAIGGEKMAIAQPVFPSPAAVAAPAPAPAPVEEDEPKDGVKYGQYVLVEKIATGGMAEVWKARMRGVEGFQKIVAIKKILPHLSDNQDFIEMFIDEAKLAAQLNHNNIIHIYDLGKIQSSYYIAMEYVDGFDLKTILRRGEERGQPMQPELALFIASKIASALDYAHRKHDFEGKEMGLVHRDVSPQNVLISQEGDIKLCDFGIAKAASKASHTQAGALKGKLQYMSPEQAWGRHIDKRSDIFALATVLFEMLTGRKLFTGDNELSILEQVREARVVPPSEINDEVTPEIDKIVLKALQKDPAQRYQTAGDMARELDQVLYSFKPTPTSADLAIYMHRIWSPEPLAQPEPEPFPEPAAAPKPVPAPAPVIAPAPVAAAPAAAIATPVFATEEPSDRKLPIIPIAIAAVVALAIGIGWFVMKGKSSAPASTVATTQSTTRTSAATTTQVTATTAATTPSPTAAAPAQTALDPSQVEAEVQKRLAADRAKLEQQARAQQQPAAAAPAAATPAPQPAAARPAPQQVAQAAPPPVATPQQTATHAPEPVQPPPQQATATRAPEPAPAPAQAAPAPQALREGDLAPAGTEGLVGARLLHRGSAPYPPLARMQHVEGTVIVSALVNEAGRVVDVRILRGIPRNVGLNEAAEDIARKSVFAPPTVNGVKVKAWTTLPVEFKL